MRKFISTFLFSVAYATRGVFQNTDSGVVTDYCLVCEYINVADDEPAAVAALEAQSNPCITAEVS